MKGTSVMKKLKKMLNTQKRIFRTLLIIYDVLLGDLKLEPLCTLKFGNQSYGIVDERSSQLLKAT